MMKKGFTIIESLISISILVLGIIGVTSAVQTGISSYIVAKDQIIAFYLAQEGFEQIRNIRDENNLKQLDWLTGLSQCLGGNTCIVDPLDQHFPGVFVEACSTPCPVLRQNSSTGFFGYDDSSWAQTIFRREVKLTKNNDNEILVEVTVYWSKGLITRQFKAKEVLFKFQ